MKSKYKQSLEELYTVYRICTMQAFVVSHSNLPKIHKHNVMQPTLPCRLDTPVVTDGFQIGHVGVYSHS